MNSQISFYRALVCSHLNGPAQIELKTLQGRELAAGEVRISVKAAALNFPDLLMTYGKYQFRPELPFILGMEGAGVILQTGEGVTGFQVGEAVTFRGKTGAIAEEIVVGIENVSSMVPTLSYEEAAAFGVTFQTAYVALVPRANLKAGQVVLIHGAGGGVGQASVAVAKALGGTVIATASTDEKLSIAKTSGADHVINYRKQNFVEEVHKYTNGRGVDVVLDPVGGDALRQSVFCLAWQGRILSVGFASGSFGEVDLRELQRRGGELVGVRAGEYGRRNPAAGRQVHSELFDLAIRKSLKPYIGKTWELQNCRDALIAMERREVVGKQVIRIK
ncbi:NADPH:quinone oxidoreductase family protein [Sneathiella glossodoripedis]|uniref:NADPH:quinone oxidoreductase family protein n=1 Tax=Sneathiella glossodoripedis TaxID=418853 RepID=UPI00046EB109|nr:NADPH:quinone oxidoreductase family protein [Sneathiella glossodoripedis]